MGEENSERRANVPGYHTGIIAFSFLKVTGEKDNTDNRERKVREQGFQ